MCLDAGRQRMVRVILVGGGHAHQQVVRSMNLASVPSSNVELILVSDAEKALYSGMVPGIVSEQYKVEDAEVDLPRLCRESQWTFLGGRVEEICASEQVLRVGDQWMKYDVLSLDVGSQTRYVEGVAEAEAEGARIIRTRPIGSLVQQVESLCQPSVTKTLRRMVVLGGGAAGVELAFALNRRLSHDTMVTLVTSSLSNLGSFRSKRARRAVYSQLVADDISVEEGSVHRVRRYAVHFHDGRRIPYDAIVLATGGEAAQWLRASTDLETDSHGFVRVGETLQSSNHPLVFAAGDCASFVKPLPKAGVFAVRMGPVLLQNIRRTIDSLRSGKDIPSLQVYKPQREYLSLLATTEGFAIGSKWGLAFQGRWVSKLKNALDTQWMAQFTHRRAEVEENRPFLASAAEGTLALLQTDTLDEDYTKQKAVLELMQEDETFRNEVLGFAHRGEELD